MVENICSQLKLASIEKQVLIPLFLTLDWPSDLPDNRMWQKGHPRALKVSSSDASELFPGFLGTLRLRVLSHHERSLTACCTDHMVSPGTSWREKGAS